MSAFPRTLFTADDQQIVERIRQLPQEIYYLESHGRFYRTIDEIGADSKQLIQLHFRCLGGKGGFGSQLRSFRIHRSTNQLMCRNLSGRRLADVKEEERLKKWIEKKPDREKAKELKAKEKYERLKRGGPKHQFSDQNYLRNRDRIMDQTEDAVEAGMKALEEKTAFKSEKPAENKDKDAASLDQSELSDSDIDILDAVSTLSTSMKSSRKRKHTSDTADSSSKKDKVEYTSEVISDSLTEEIITENCENATVEEVQKQSLDLENSLLQDIQNIDKSLSDGANGAPEVEKVTEKVVKVPIEYPGIDLVDFDSITHLEELGLDHLRSALEARGLKCGGSLHERAARLFSVRGLNENEYPKNVKARTKK